MIYEEHPQNGCCICQEVNDRRLPEPIRHVYGISDRICLETADFIALPTVSPLVDGHMLVFAKNHVPSLRTLSLSLTESLCRLATQIAAQVSSEHCHPYFFEHGVMEDGKGSCGITHAHLHILPLNSKVAATVTREAATTFPPQLSGSLSTLLSPGRSNDSPYLLFGESLSALHLAFATTIPSQFMRRLIATSIGVGDWNWRSLTGVERFRRTLNSFYNAQAA